MVRTPAAAAVDPPRFLSAGQKRDCISCQQKGGTQAARASNQAVYALKSS